MAIITARVNDDKKAQAQKIADELGVSLSTLINMRISSFIRTKEIHVSLDDTTLGFYEGSDTIEVREDAQVVADYLQSIAVDE